MNIQLLTGSDVGRLKAACDSMRWHFIPSLKKAFG
jgi:hypothetical protein